MWYRTAQRWFSRGFTGSVPPMEAVDITTIDHIRTLLPDWRRHLKARNRTESTIASYLRCGENLAVFLTAQGMPQSVGNITREHLESFFGDLLDRVSPATVAKHYRSLQQFWKWLAEDGEIERSPMQRMQAPQVPEQPVPVVTDEELKRLLAACKGTAFDARRDYAILWVLIDTGVRLGEITGMQVDDIDWNADVITVLGKGRRRRNVPFGPEVADALRRYLRARARNPKAANPALWLGKRGPMTESGITQVLRRRGAEAGVDHLHPHRLRHTFAHAWLAAGHGETDLMRLSGWKSRQMLSRYAASAADARALEAHKRAGLGRRLG